MQLRRKISNWLFIVIILSINIYWLVIFDLKIYQVLHLVILFAFVFIVYDKRKSICLNTFSYRGVIAMILLPLPSIFVCWYLHHQPIYLSMILYRMHLGWLIYFVLHAYKIEEQKVINTIAIVGFGFAALTLGQQITFPFAPFGERTIFFGISRYHLFLERRFGFLRFYLYGYFYATIILFVILAGKYVCKHKGMALVFLFMAEVAHGSKNNIIACILGILFYIILGRNIKKFFLYGSIACIAIVFAYTYSEDWAYMLDSNQEKEYYEETRLGSLTFFWSQYISNPLIVLFGNGLGHEDSYGAIQNNMMDGDTRVVVQDCGILRTASYWGGLYVLTYIVMLFRLLFHKHLALEYKAIIITIFISMPFVVHVWEIHGMISQAILIYLCDINIKNNTKHFTLL